MHDLSNGATVTTKDGNRPTLQHLPQSDSPRPIPYSKANTPPTTPKAAAAQIPLPDSPNTIPAAPLEEEEESVELELALELEPVAVPELEPEVEELPPVGVADAAGKVEPAALTSKGADVA